MTAGLMAGKRGLIMGLANDKSIAWGIAKALADHGAEMAFSYQGEALKKRVGPLAERLGSDFVLPCDVTDRNAVESMMRTTADELGGIDILVNNAGGGLERSPVGQDDPDNWRAVIDVNLIGTYNCARAALPFLKAGGGGTIINVGSGMGHQARANNSSLANAADAASGSVNLCRLSYNVSIWRHVESISARPS